MPQSDWKHQMLMREDIGYGPARQYEPADGPGSATVRERRGAGREVGSPARDLGPYHQRLQRRQRPDSWIQAELEEVLFLDTWIDADKITVDVKNGVATLVGTMAGRWEIERALQDARRVPGLTQLRNRLEVET